MNAGVTLPRVVAVALLVALGLVPLISALIHDGWIQPRYDPDNPPPPPPVIRTETP